MGGADDSLCPRLSFFGLAGFGKPSGRFQIFLVITGLAHVSHSHVHSSTRRKTFTIWTNLKLPQAVVRNCASSGIPDGALEKHTKSVGLYSCSLPYGSYA